MINAKDSKNTFYILDKKTDVPIVFIHGVGLNHKIWEPQINVFENTFLAYDILGHGKTPLNKENLSFDESKQNGDMKSLYECIDKCLEMGRIFIADPILDPINYGFTESIHRYRALRKEYPEIEILMGTGNVTELTDADTSGMNALLIGIASELNINNVLVVQVSDHTLKVVEETDLARKIMYESKKDNSLPVGYDSGLISLLSLIHI